MAAALAVPTVSLAGKAVTAGDQSLQIGAQVSPNVTARPGKGGSMLKLKVDYRSLNEDAQVSETTKAVTLTLPKGMKIHTERRPTCLVSAAFGEQGEAACPAASRVGGGTATADARPSLPAPIDAEVHIYNALDDTNADGSLRDPAIPAVLLFAKTTLGLDAILPFDLVAPNVLRLDYAPPKEGDPAQLYHLQTFKIGFPLKKGSAYVTNPGRCPKGFWRFRMTIDNFDGPSVTAGHKVDCREP